MIFIISARMVRDSGSNSAGGGWGEGTTQQRFIRWSSTPEVQPLTCRKHVQVYIQLFPERLSQKLDATIPKSIVGGFIWVHCSSKEFERMAGKGMEECLRVLKESVKKGSVKCRLRTTVFRVRKQWHYCCHVLICMVKTIVAVRVLNWPASKVGSTASRQLIISHITFGDCHVHIFSDNHSRNSCIWYFHHVVALAQGGGMLPDEIFQI